MVTGPTPTIPIPATRAMILDDFVVRAALAGFGIALIAGPLGCFVVWQRMAFLGEAVANSALLGIALGLLLGLNLTVGIVIAGLSAAALLAALQAQRVVPMDSLLGIATHAALAAGLVVIGLMETVRVDLMGYLFGDILSVGLSDVIGIYAGSAFAIVALAFIWRPLIAITVNVEMAAAEGVPVGRVRATFLLLIALMIALAIKVVGALLVISLLIIPAAAARASARTPEAMAMIASLLGLVAIGAGLGLSLTWNVPTGPAIVLAAAVLFVAMIAPAALRAAWRR